MPASASSLDIWQMKQNQISCLAGGFYVLKSQISCKIYLEPSNHALSPCVGLIERVCNSI